MLTLPASVRIYVAAEAVDLRRGFDGLAAAVRSVIREDPLSGHLFIFFSKRRDRIRVVYWDRNGFAMWTKRLESGRFRPRFSSDGRLGSVSVEAAELALIVEGIELAGARRRSRWHPPSTPEKKSSRATAIS